MILLYVSWLAACTSGDPDERRPPGETDPIGVDTDRPDTDRPDTDRPDTDPPPDTDLPDTDPPASDWVEGDPHPAFLDLLPLPGGASGVPVFTSNNPETYTSTGFLYEAAREDPQRGGASWPLSGDFAVYLHHANDAGKRTYVQLLVTNPNAEDITVQGGGTAWTNQEKPLMRGGGPDYAVTGSMLSGVDRNPVPLTVIQPFKAAAVWSARLDDGVYIDGRFALATSAPAYVYTIVTDADDANEAVNLSQTPATGNIHPPGDPPPPYGREAGVYAADTWAGAWTLPVPPAGRYAGYAVNTATGSGHPQIQAFPALTAFDDSSKEAVGMYGNLYDLTITLEPGVDAAGTVDVVLASYGGGSPTFWFNGPIGVDDETIPVWLAPDQREQVLATRTIGGSPVTIHLRVPVPGLSSIPLGLILVTR